MPYIVVKLEQRAGGDELAVTDEMKVASKVEDAVNRIGAWTGDIFAVWSLPVRPNPKEALEYTRSVAPESMWVISGDMPFELKDRYLNEVIGAGRD
ncbi:hypothetical protein ACWD7Y_04080 [Streptomyces drozdowiczii]